MPSDGSKPSAWAWPDLPLGAMLLGGAYLALVLAMCASMSGCATQPKPEPVAAVSCLPLKAYTSAEQKALAEQYRAIPKGSPLESAMVDYLRMRDADRACLASHR